MSGPSVVVLCGGSPRHIYLANQLCRSLNVLAVVQEVGRSITLPKVLKLLRPRHFVSKAGRWLRDRRRYWGDAEARFFFGDSPVRLDRPELHHAVNYINAPDTLAIVNSRDPDVIAVFGTSLIRPPLLGKGRLGMLNLHGGLSPHYRGADCTFWALFNGEPDQVGCTLHFINAGIDTGALIAHVCPEVREGDDEFTLFWRGVRDSAPVYVEAIQRLGRGEKVGQPQREKGRLYQVKDRTWAREREFARRWKDGVVRGVTLPRRVRWFE